MLNNIALVIVSCDKYMDTWEPFFKCLDRFWMSLNINKYLITNIENDIKFDVNVINTGPEVSWSSKVRVAMNYIKEDYILLFLDDYFIDTPVNQKDIDSLLSLVDSLNIDYLSFEQAKSKRSIGSKMIAEISTSNVYGKVLQPAVWRKSYFQKCLYDDNFSAWEFESRQKYRSKIRVNGNDYCVKKRFISWQNGVLQGKWYPIAIDKLSKLGITVETKNRDVLSKSSLLKYRLKFHLAKHLPFFLAYPTRRVLEIFGIKFVSK